MVHQFMSVSTLHIPKRYFFQLQDYFKKIHLHGWQFYPKGHLMRSGHLNMRVGDREVRDVLHIVLHVLGLVNNLFLVSKASTQGFKVEF